jgi:glycosyltransferase involved in cell wall biosynthesis
LRTSLGFKPEEIVCISVGRLVPVKGLSDLLSAFAIAHNQNPELRLLLVGDGELRQDLEREVQELKIGDVVQLVGWREDIPELLDVADLFVLTSHNEGLGLVLVEAMVKKLPVVATAVGGVPEVVIDGVTGSLVPAGDSVAIASAIARFAENGEMRASMGQRGYERANEFFTIDKTVQYTEDLYKTLLGSPA